MAKRATIQDLAKASGVSVATVDRVLNGRTKVRAETAHRVFEAAHKLGYHATNLISQRLQVELPRVRLGIILQKEQQSFYKQFRAALERQAGLSKSFNVSLRIEFATTQSPSEVAQLMRSMRGQVDAVAATAMNHSDITSAVIDLKSVGIPTVALLSDFAQGDRVSYIGSNNLKVGRNAAWMLSQASVIKGKMALFVGGHRWHGHELRETGWRSYFREMAPEFQLLDTFVNLETRQLTYEATLDLLARHKDLAGIYLAGGGMEGAMQALREVRAPGDVALVVNELTPESRKGLVDRYVTMVVSTPLDDLCREMIDLMGHVATSHEYVPPSQVFMDSIVTLPELI